ncbi:translation initiation factor IF-3, mitochondrial [Malaya genurostris]|uniref:translation initiation factor IF-3, mitochondrial n=1 Tax=Malaya genurostris TaxID=325434 RepID=UPI0026F3A207|nr:translation initiation factor IF-3, mitochondrial [Malaya genurostris]
MNIFGNILRCSIRNRLIITGSFQSCLPTISTPVAAVSFIHHSVHTAKTHSGSSDSGQSTDSVKPKSSSKITLVGTDETVTIVSIDEAQKISKRRDLKLVKIIDLDIKTHRPVYKLMTSAEFLTEDLKRRQKKNMNREEKSIKGNKLLSISARITNHDLNSKCQNVMKWLKKNYEVRVVVSGDGDKTKQEAVAARFEETIKGIGKIVQQRFSENNLRFTILPITSSSDQEITKSNKKDLYEANQKSCISDTHSIRTFHTYARLLA